MADLLKGRLAAVTGAGSGIGRAIATAYAREGAVVALLDVNEKAAAAVAADIKNAGGKAHSFALDVTNRGQCANVAAQVASTVGTISVLVNNAGIIRRNPFTGDAAAVARDWDDTLTTNLDGVFNVTQAFVGQLRASKGCVVNIGSIQSFLHMRTPSSAAYTAAKHGVLGLTRALAAELGKEGIRVNAIGPGLIETPLNEQMRTTRPEVLKIFIDHTPLGRAGKPEEIAGPAVFLASDLATFVNGAILMVDGGYLTV